MYKLVNGKQVPLNEREIKEFQERELKHKDRLEELKKTEYQIYRCKEYPSIVDQLDDLYHLGYGGWKAKIKAIKDKYPKPEGV